MSVQMQQVNLSTGQLVAGRYAIERELGKGGMGRVYMARQRPFDRPVVIKIMHPKYLADENLRQRFFNEARAASQLSHPNSITVFDFGKTDDDVYFIAMEYVDGVTLREALEQGPMSLDRAAPIIVQVAQSLGEAHRKSIIHRDLKPENIMLGRPGTADEFVKVLDFGIAKVMDNQTGITQTGSVFGTPGYMAPEQGRAEEIDHTVDLYSLTCCFYELLTGEMPFSGESALQVMMRHQSDDVPQLPAHLPARLNEFMQRGMAKSPNARPEDADQYVAALLASLSNKDDDARRAAGTPRGGVERPSSGQFMQGSTPSPAANRSSDQLGSSGGSIPSPDEIGSGRQRRAGGTNPSPPPSNSGLPRPGQGSGENQKATKRVDSSPLRSEIERADTRPSASAQSQSNPGSSPRYASADSAPPPQADSHPSNPSGNLNSGSNPPPRSNGSGQNRAYESDSIEPFDPDAARTVGPDASGEHELGHDSRPSGNPPPMHSSGSAPQLQSPARGVQPSPAQGVQQTPGTPHPSSGAPAQAVAQGTPRPDPSTQTIPRAKDDSAARYWAIAATIISAILAAVVVMLSFDDSKPMTGKSGVAAGAAAESVSVTVDSRPSDALVEIDGKEVGVTPTDYSARPGETLQISISKNGYETRELTHAVDSPSGDNKIFASLDARSVDLTVSVPVDGAEVLVNGESYGKLAANNPRNIELEWPEDELRVVISHASFEDYVQRFPASAVEPSLEVAPDQSDLVTRQAP